MRKHYDELQDDLTLEVSQGEPEIPGLETFVAGVLIPGGSREEIRAFTEDIVSDLTFTLRPQDEPHVGDKINGATVIMREVVKDVRGKIHRWVAYAKK